MSDRTGEEAPETGEGDGDVAITNPVTGVAIHPGGEDDPEGVAELRLAPGAGGPAEHVHPDTEERFRVLAGEVTFRVDGRERSLRAGTGVRVSPGTPHAFRNAGGRPARIRVRTLPPNERLGAVVATLFGLAHEGAVDDRGRPGPLQGAVMAEAASDEVYFTGAPRGLQTAVGRLLGPVGRALGYRATYDRFLEEGYWRERERERERE